MGDRANIVIRDEAFNELHEKEAIFLYSHWGGYNLPETLREALAGRSARARWTDGSYLARIIFDHVIGDAQGGETGHGLSTRMTDNEYDLLVVLPRTQTIVRVPEQHWGDHGFTDLDELPQIGFEDYIEVDERTWDNLTSVEIRT